MPQEQEGDKSALRALLRARRDALSAQYRGLASAAIGERLLSEPVLLRARRVGLYAAIGSEVDATALFNALLASGRETYFPRADRKTGKLELVRVESLATLVPGAFGVPEPVGPAAAPASLDVIVVPGLGFDRAGVRLGYGGGFYDRTLCELTTSAAVGIGFDCQLVGALPRHAHDRPMDLVVTETAVHVALPGGAP